MPRRYAQGTSVGYHRSREQIGRLLEQWGATGVQWTDEWKPEPKFICRFLWDFEDEEGKLHPLMARFALCCDDELLKERSVDGRTGGLNENKYEKNRKQWVNEAHRLLLLILKAMFNGIEAGLFTPEELFASFIEHQSGVTVGELFAKQISKLPTLCAKKLLASGMEGWLVRIGNIEVPDLQVWLRSRRVRWEELRFEYEGARKTCPVDELIEVLDDCEALADALEEKR